jgi:acyl-CoA synthetase (AMP-forming)/AMP-acid ligase II
MNPPFLQRISDYPAYYAARNPDAEAMWFEGQSVNYASLDRMVDAFARSVIALDLPAGARIAVLSTPRPEVWVALLGIIKAGYIYVGLNPRYTLPELDYVIGDSQPSIIFSLAAFEQTEFAPVIAELAQKYPFVRSCFRLDKGEPAGCLQPFDDFLAVGAAVADPKLFECATAVIGRDPALIVYTSGSTGRPKGALIPHDALVYGPHQNATIMGVEAPRVICSMPFNHIGCVADVCSSTLVPGGMIAFTERPDVPAVLPLIEQLRITSLQHVPTVLHALIKQPDFATRDLSSLKVVAWGGSAMPLPAIKVFRQMGLRMMETYGQTESISNICFADHTYTDEQLALTVGRPDPNQEVRLCDDEGRQVGKGEPGEIRARHSKQMLGYFNRPEATATAWDDDGFLCTGDIAIEEEDGTLRLVGRKSEFFKSGGYNVYPREIELCLEEHPAVGLVAVVDMPHPTFAEVGVAYVQSRPGAVAPSQEDLRIWCRDRLANYKIPKLFVIDRELPLLPIGKVDKQRLRRELREGAPTII